MFQVARVEKFEETTFVDPLHQPLPAKPHILPLRVSKAIFFVWNLFISGFWPKPILSNQLGIFKPPRPLGIVNIQAQISGLSFGVARVLFSDF